MARTGPGGGGGRRHAAILYQFSGKWRRRRASTARAFIPTPRRSRSSWHIGSSRVRRAQALQARGDRVAMGVDGRRRRVHVRAVVEIGPEGGDELGPQARVVVERRADAGGHAGPPARRGRRRRPERAAATCRSWPPRRRARRCAPARARSAPGAARRAGARGRRRRATGRPPCAAQARGDPLRGRRRGARGVSSVRRAGSSAHTTPSSCSAAAPGNCSAMVGTTQPARSGCCAHRPIPPCARALAPVAGVGQQHGRVGAGALAQRAHQRAAAARLGLVALQGEGRQRHQRRQADDVARRGRRLAAVGERDHRAQRLRPGADRRLGGQRRRHPGRAVHEPVGHVAADLRQAPVGRARRDRPGALRGRHDRDRARPRPRPRGGRSRPARRRPRRPRPCARAGRPGALRAGRRGAQGWEPKGTRGRGECQPTLCARSRSRVRAVGVCACCRP